MKSKNGLRLAGLSLGGWLMTVNLAAAAPGQDGAPDIGGPGVGYFIWVIVALMLVIGLIVLLIKWLSARNRGWGNNRALRSLGGIPLGPNKSLQVVELSGRVYVVGVGDSITLLDKIEDAYAASAVLEAIDQQNSRHWNSSSIADLLSRLRNRKQNIEPTSEPWQAAASFQEMLQDKMKRQSVQKQKVEDLLKEQNHNDRLLDE
ncbi:flagellar biosynthetic protein FliO [Paenibacillus sp. sptzw28]|uniref:flagellar biosynthetic protein FliO n=1 Tax=Paenibacillus sp. sptzw28 TaxID=715179 RepID=UPI001C6F180C|nr:flagellar biosynthetic protein FliO [Paenibacillus sp. sptzw28]QYR19761.1 flagellar biosynthetic protein FliO [Paenibacillus sp. sptzw28]